MNATTAQANLQLRRSLGSSNRNSDDQSDLMLFQSPDAIEREKKLEKLKQLLYGSKTKNNNASTPLPSTQQIPIRDPSTAASPNLAPPDSIYPRLMRCPSQQSITFQPTPEHAVPKRMSTMQRLLIEFDYNLSDSEDTTTDSASDWQQFDPLRSGSTTTSTTTDSLSAMGPTDSTPPQKPPRAPRLRTSHSGANLTPKTNGHTLATPVRASRKSSCGLAPSDSYTCGLKNASNVDSSNVARADRAISCLHLVDKCTNSLEVQLNKLCKRLLMRSEERFDHEYEIESQVLVAARLPPECRPPCKADSIKLIVHTSSETYQFTSDIAATVDHVIEQVICIANMDTACESYLLKVFGSHEFLVSDTMLCSYVFVHQCLKMCLDVRLVLVKRDDIGCRTSSPPHSLPNVSTWLSDTSSTDKLVTVSKEELEMLLDLVKTQHTRLQQAAPSGDIAGPSINLKQAIKQVCLHMGRLQPYDLFSALRKFDAECQEILEERKLFTSVQEAKGTSTAGSYTASPDKVNRLRQHLCAMIEALVRHVGMYCSASCTPFTVPPIAPSGLSTDAEVGGPRREICSVEFELAVKIESLHNMPPAWTNKYDYYIITCIVIRSPQDDMHRPQRSTDFGSIEQHSVSMFPSIYFNDNLTFTNLNLCVLPRETCLCLTLYGLDVSTSGSASPNVNHNAAAPTMVPTLLTPPNHVPPDLLQAPSSTQNGVSSASGLTRVRLATARLSLFGHEDAIRQGSFLLPLCAPQALPSWGPDSLSRPFDAKSAMLLISMPCYGGFDIVFPQPDSLSQVIKNDFYSLDKDNQELLLEILEDSSTALRDEPLPENEREVLWERRSYLMDVPSALPLVLSCVVSWDWASLNAIYPMIHDWSPLSPNQAFELLLPIYNDREVRHQALKWLERGALSDDLVGFLPQLVEALRFEPWEDSHLAEYLVSKAVQHRRFGHALFWELESRWHCSDIATDVFAARCYHLQQILLWLIGDDVSCGSQRRLVTSLDAVALGVQRADNSDRTTLLKTRLSALRPSIAAETPAVPLDPALLARDIDVKESSFFSSRTHPLKVSLVSDDDARNALLYKIGDDLRQDCFVLQMLRLMERVWWMNDLDLRMITYNCLPTGQRKGMISLVPDCKTFREIHDDGGLTGPLKDALLMDWIKKQNQSELECGMAIDNFRRSCAGWCVGTFVLGIGDRHNDNILVTRRGHVFHIDFGKYLGDAQTFGTLRRDRAPFVLTADMAYVINEGANKDTRFFQDFVDLACRAYNAIRRQAPLFLNLIKTMVFSGVPGLNMSAVQYIHQNLQLSCSDAEATSIFTSYIEASLGARFTRVNFLVHSIAQRTAGSAPDSNNNQLLSFVPQIYTLSADGKITSVCVVGYEKRREPEKHYLYQIKVERLNEVAPTIIYRTYDEFSEFHHKLTIMHPLAKFHPLPSSRDTVGRTQVRAVAERRKFNISLFLLSMCCMADEIAHCDLVYTFFHPLLRDTQEADRPFQEQIAKRTASSVSSPFNVGSPPEAGSSTKVTGEVKISVEYRRNCFEVMIHHARNLALIDNQVSPDPYVKVYLQPDPGRISKRKTKLMRRNVNPTFNERLVYVMPFRVLQSRSLEITVWHHDYVRENSFLGGVVLKISDMFSSDDGSSGSSDVSSKLISERWFPLQNIRMGGRNNSVVR